MRLAAILWTLLSLVSLAPAQAAGPVVPDDLVVARLVSERSAVGPGQVLWVDLHLEVKPGWHIYWRDPGDAGLPTAIEWHLPSGFSAGEIEWPVPEHFVVGPLGNYGYSGTADLLVPMTAPAPIEASGPVRIEGDASWLVCSEICIPGEAKLALDLPVATSSAPSDPETAAMFAAARRAQPRPANFETRFSAAAKQFRLLVPAAALGSSPIATAFFFPFDANLIDNAAEPRIERTADGIALTLARPKDAAAVPATIDGVLALRDTAGTRHGFTISANPVAAPLATDDGAGGVVWWQALAFAFLGGIVLNLMPCVFPVLSLKVLSLSGLGDRRTQRQHGIAYGLGVVLSFAALGGLLLSLRAGGAAVGWGFQLQSPVVVGGLAYLLFAMGLSLSGVAEFGAGLAGLGNRFAGRSGVIGAFATGMLATIVATPCTAPFMGTALGVALVASAPLALAIFIALGFGLAAPFVLVSLIPGLRRILPRPGGWMVLFRQLLAFPLYGTVAWLVWVLMQEVGPRGSLAALLGLVCVGFAVWVYGRTQLAAPAARRLGIGLAAAAMIAAALLTATVGPAGAGAATGRQPAREGLVYETFDAARLSSLAAEHKPVFVNLTAAWCLTCLVNEAAALDSAAVRRAFAARGIVALKGDWTRQNPQITAFLQKFGRSGVPLYLLYDRAGNATVLPQILTEATVLAAVGKI